MEEMPKLPAYLSEQTGRQVTAAEVYEAAELARATFHRQLKTVAAPGIVIRVARKFEVNPVKALMDLGYVTESELRDLFNDLEIGLADATDEDLAEEMLRRARIGSSVLTDPLDDDHPAVQKLDAETDAPSNIRQLRPWGNAPTYNPNDKPDFSELDAASRGEKQTIPENGLESP